MIETWRRVAAVKWHHLIERPLPRRLPSLNAALMPSAAIQRPGSAPSDVKSVFKNSFQKTVIA
jgi:hypothetical protein